MFSKTFLNRLTNLSNPFSLCFKRR